MKTSFYFIVWIVIYPLLYLTGMRWVMENAFFVALVAVWFLSTLINRSMGHIIAYERLRQASGVLADIYNGNIKAFLKRLSRETVITFVTAVYFGATLVFIIFTFYKSDVSDWLALVIFGFMAFASIASANQFNKARLEVKENPTPETCAEVAGKIYKMNYEVYCRSRVDGVPMPEAPRGYRAFQISSLVIAIICVILGAIYIILSLKTFFFDAGTARTSGAVMSLLYGALALNFGIKDMMSSFDVLIKSKNQ